MSRLSITVLIVFTLVFAVAADLSAARTKESFDQLTGEILATLQSFYPVHATEMGIHAYDHRLADYSAGSVKQMRAKLTGYVERLHRYRDFAFSVPDSIDYRLIRSNVELALLDIKEIKWHERSPQLYIDEAVNGVYFLLLSQHAPMGEKALSVVARMKAVPELFQTARRNLKNPPKVYIDLADESLTSAQSFYQEVAGELMRQFPERADEILQVSTQAREAMNDFATYLSSLTPGPETAFAVGKVNFDYMLSHGHFLTYDSDSLLRIGENLLAAAQQEYTLYQQYVEESHQKGRDSVFIPTSFCKNDVLDYYRWEIEQAKLFLSENDIVTIPEDIAPVEVVETPAFLRSIVAGSAYQPAGPFDRTQRGIFYVRPIPDSLDPAQRDARYRYVYRRGFKGSAVHEAYPGHHLQMQLAGRNPSAIRRWQTNSLMTEGWALYSEELMYQAGLYGDEDPAVWLAILGGIRYRAARIVADVKLSTGQFTYEQCVDWMIKTLEAETESDKDYQRKMIRKYTLTPTVWMTYLIGKIEIERLRDDLRQREGEGFDERAFYDQMLSLGSIPLALARQSFGL